MLAIASSILPTEAFAQQARSERQQIDISAGTLPRAVAELAREAHVSIGTEGSLPNTRTRALRGRITVSEALARLLRGSGWVARQVGPTAWRIEPALLPEPTLAPAPTPAPAPAPVPLAPPQPIMVRLTASAVALTL